MIKDSDFEISFIRGSGPGGQRKNKVSTGVRLTHKPTGIVVEATEEREQSKNRIVAFERLEQRLKDIAAEQKAARKKAQHDAKPDASFGNYRRTYRMVQPAGVVDVLTGHKELDVKGVLDGKIEGFLKR